MKYFITLVSILILFNPSLYAMQSENAVMEKSVFNMAGNTSGASEYLS